MDALDNQDQLRGELGLAQAEIDRLKLKLAERPLPTPPDSFLEKAVRRVGVEASWVASSAMASGLVALAVELATVTCCAFVMVLGLAYLLASDPKKSGAERVEPVVQSRPFGLCCPVCSDVLNVRRDGSELVVQSDEVLLSINNDTGFAVDLPRHKIVKINDRIEIYHIGALNGRAALKIGAR